jgi:murein DD-endopeptidase MepM/ murein hydrolase activator NlpD
VAAARRRRPVRCDVEAAAGRRFRKPPVKGMTMTLGRPRPVPLLIALAGVLAVLCCGGSVALLLVDELAGDHQRLNADSFGCGSGGTVDPDSELPRVRFYGPAQLRNAAIIINTGVDLGVPPRGWVIAVATAMQESRLTNLGDLGSRNDHDSLGLFQQRPSAGWGTPTQVRDPVYAATKFYNKMLAVDDWAKLPLTVVAQRVQRSAYPGAYAKHEVRASQIVNLLADGAARAVGSSTKLVCPAASGAIAASGWTVPWLTKGVRSARGGVGSGFRTAERPTHQGVDIALPRYTPIVAVASGVVSVAKCDLDNNGRRSCDEDGWPGKGGCGWMVEIVHAANVMSRYCHMVRSPSVRVGQQVAAGQPIAQAGTSGNSSGPHLHFEIHQNNDRSSSGAVDPVAFMRIQGAPLNKAGDD